MGKGRRRKWANGDVAAIQGGWAPTGNFEHRGKRYFAECRCACGSVGWVRVLGDGSLRSEKCGSCAMKEGRFALEHGHCTEGKVSPTYYSWAAMLSRTKNANATGFHNYGGRGVKVCERWKVFANFVADMGERPDGTEIERKDNDGDYSPENCVWATRKAQGRNRRTNRMLTIEGETKTAVEWAESPIARATHGTILDRLARGWSAKDAVTLPRQRSGAREKKTSPLGARLNARTAAGGPCGAWMGDSLGQ